MNQDDDDDSDSSSEESEEEEQRSLEFRYFYLPKIKQKHVQPVYTQPEFMNAELSWKRKLRENPPDLPLPQSLAPGIQAVIDRLGRKDDLYFELVHAPVTVKAYQEAAAEFASSVQTKNGKELYANYMNRATASITGGLQPPTFLQQLINDLNYSKNRNVVRMTQKRSFMRPKPPQPRREYVCFVNYYAENLKEFFGYPYARIHNDMKDDDDDKVTTTGPKADPAAALNLFYEVYVKNQKTALLAADRRLLEGQLGMTAANQDGRAQEELQALGYVNNMSDNPGLNRDILNSFAISLERMCKKLDDRDHYYRDVPGAIRYYHGVNDELLQGGMSMRHDGHRGYWIPSSMTTVLDVPRWGKQSGWVKEVLQQNVNGEKRQYEDPSALYDDDPMREQLPSSVHGYIKMYLSQSMIPLDAYNAMVDILPKDAKIPKPPLGSFPEILTTTDRLPGTTDFLLHLGYDGNLNDDDEEEEELVYGYDMADPEQPSFMRNTNNDEKLSREKFVSDYPEIMKPFLGEHDKEYMKALEHSEDYDIPGYYADPKLYYPDTEYFRTKREFKRYRPIQPDLERWMESMSISGVIRDPINNAVVYLIDMKTQNPLRDLIRKKMEPTFVLYVTGKETYKTIASTLTHLIVGMPWHYSNISGEYPLLEELRRNHDITMPACLLMRPTMIMALYMLERRIFEITNKPKDEWGAVRILRWRMQSQNMMRALITTDTNYILKTNSFELTGKWIGAVQALHREILAYIYASLMASTKFSVNGTLTRNQITDIARSMQEGYLPYSCLTWITSRVSAILWDIIAAYYQASFSKKRDKPAEYDDDDDDDEETGERPQKRTKIRDADLRFLIAMFRKISVKQ